MKLSKLAVAVLCMTAVAAITLVAEATRVSSVTNGKVTTYSVIPQGDNEQGMVTDFHVVPPPGRRFNGTLPGSGDQQNNPMGWNTRQVGSGISFYTGNDPTKDPIPPGGTSFTVTGGSDSAPTRHVNWFSTCDGTDNAPPYDYQPGPKKKGGKGKGPKVVDYGPLEGDAEINLPTVGIGGSGTQGGNQFGEGEGKIFSYELTDGTTHVVVHYRRKAANPSGWEERGLRFEPAEGNLLPGEDEDGNTVGVFRFLIIPLEPGEYEIWAEETTGPEGSFLETVPFDWVVPS